MRALAMMVSLLGGCVLVPPASTTPTTPTTPTAPTTSPTTAIAPVAPEPAPARDDELHTREARIPRDQAKVLVGMTLDGARAQLATWGYHGDLTIDRTVINSDVPNCDDKHVCGFFPYDFELDEPLALETRKSVKIAAPPP